MYVWLKAFHVIAIIAWMAGMLYLPRLFVYHCEAEPGSQQSETFKVMERRRRPAVNSAALGGGCGPRSLRRPWWRVGRLAYGSHGREGFMPLAGCMPSWSWLSRSPPCMAFLCATCANSPPTAIAILNDSIAFSMRYRPFS